jgi:hypothetical protein
MKVESSHHSAVSVHQKLLPIGGNSSRWSRYRLIERVVQRWRESGSIEELVRAIVPKPIFTGLKTSDNWVTGRMGVCCRMLSQRVIAAPDVAALRAAA